MNEPKLRFPEFTGNWKQHKISEVGNIVTGSTPKTSISENYGGDFLFVSPVDIQGNRYVDKTITTLTKKGFDQGRKIRKNASLFVSIGSTIGKVAQTSQELTTNQQINAVEPYNNFDDNFIFTSLENISANIKAIASNQAVPIVNKTTFGNVEIRVPSELVEQKKIGFLFAELDTLIQSAEKELEGYRELKQGMLQKMFPKRNEATPEISFLEFDGNWEQCKLGDIGKTYTSLSGKTADDFGHGEANFITYMNVYSNSIADPTMVAPIEIDAKQHEVEVGDVFFTTSSETPDEVGMSCVLIEKQGIVYLNSFCFGFRPTKSFDLNFLAYMLRSNYVRNQIKILAQGVSRYNISKTKMMDVSIIFPDYEEQKKIGEYFSNLDNLINLQQKEIDGYKELKKGLLQQMFC